VKRMTDQIAVRTSREVHDRLRRCVIHAMRNDPNVTLTHVVVRGIELACDEIESRYGMIPKDINVIRLRAGRRVTRRDK